MVNESPEAGTSGPVWAGTDVHGCLKIQNKIKLQEFLLGQAKNNDLTDESQCRIKLVDLLGAVPVQFQMDLTSL